MGSRVYVCFPSFQHHHPSIGEIGEGGGSHDSGHPDMADQAVVSDDRQAAGSGAETATQAGALPSSAPTEGASTGGQAETSRLSIVRDKYELEGLPSFIVDFLVSSWREGTQVQYEVYLRKWLSFCEAEQISVLSPSVGQVLHYLWKLFQDGLGYSAINTARSALSAVIEINGAPVGHHALIKRFVRAAFQQHPALPKNTVVWDADIVLTYLRSLSPVKLIPIKLLTHKLTMLLLLLSGQRQQTIHLLDVRNMTLSGSSAKFRIGDVVKQSRPGTHVHELSFKGYAPDRRLCIVTVLREYLKRTLPVRGAEKHCFSRTVARCMRHLVPPSAGGR